MDKHLIPAVVPLELIERLSQFLAVAVKVTVTDSPFTAEYTQALSWLREAGPPRKTVQLPMATVPVPRDVLSAMYESLEEAAQWAQDIPERPRALIQKGFTAAGEAVALWPLKVDGGPLDVAKAHDTVSLDFGALRVTFLTDDGEPAELFGEGSARAQAIRTCNFLVEGPGINPYQIRAVEIPRLDYTDDKPLQVKVELFPFPVEPPPAEAEDDGPQPIGVETVLRRRFREELGDEASGELIERLLAVVGDVV